ncbi:uncharacterized protein LTR77_005663 [Saxophila tyrrhenica]|uniref:DUF833-domain-containing protein n=1 Tax=Saxophila tyrrhenica TaxID=1690608 RepID=A0AAV9PD98_9PEZI|nr:hypothetical protein LTR77_005663 [Saxophila tyrrhenica]
MCIALISTAHPAYPLILLSNRDEFLNRPTAPAQWWSSPHSHVLGGRDLQRAEQGTWLAITKQGRIAVLTNFREEGDTYHTADKSRGAIPNAYVTQPPERKEGSEDFARRLIEEVGVGDVGGFSLVFGELRPWELKDGAREFPGLSIVSNRSVKADDLVTIATAEGETHGLSNSHFGDRSWPKVVHGEELLNAAIEDDFKDGNRDQSGFAERLFEILSIDKLPKRKQGEAWDTYVRQMRNSILIPPVGGISAESKPADSMASGKDGVDTPDRGNVEVREFGYGTQKQTVVLVDNTGRVKFIERTLYDQEGRTVRVKDGQREFTFEIEGWQDP